MSDKQNYFMFTANYKDLSLGDSIQVYFGTFSFPAKNITKSMIKQIENQTLDSFKLSNPNSDVHEYKVVSLSHLGEMTAEEFNS